jgi:hypothetical protein
MEILGVLGVLGFMLLLAFFLKKSGLWERFKRTSGW